LTLETADEQEPATFRTQSAAPVAAHEQRQQDATGIGIEIVGESLAPAR
jgi:hypothetical protein